MPKITVLFAAILIAQGLIGYFGATPKTETPEAGDVATDATAENTAVDEEADKKGVSVTALIPAFVGAPLLLCGLIGFAGGKTRMHAMHVAAMIGLLGALAGLKGVVSLIQMLGGAEVNQRAMTMALVMGAICAVYTFLCVQSFIAARKAREAEAAKGTEGAEGA